MPKSALLALLCVFWLGAAGCANQRIVRAAPPSVSEPPPPPQDTQPMPQPATPSPAVTPAEDQPAPEVTPPEPPPAPAKRPVAPKRPAPSETAEPTQPKPAPPQISPQLSPRDLETAKNNTNANLAAAKKNLQQSNGRQLNAAQKDLADKISSFLTQSQDAINANDWVRAENLAEKARVLSTELVKSF